MTRVAQVYFIKICYNISMENLRESYTYQDRLEFQSNINTMRPYILPLLLQRQNNVCNICKVEHKKYDIDHLIYNPMITINELQALCHDCHKSITNYIPYRNR